MLEFATRFEELSWYWYATVDVVIKRNEKFIHGPRSKLARGSLPYLRDPCDVIVEMTAK